MVVNWAGNATYAGPLRSPASVAELQRIVAAASRVRAVGTLHSFNDLPDTPGDLVSVRGLPPEVDIDSERGMARVGAGLRFSDVAPLLHARAFALPTLASLPHISVGGGCATASHGSGVGNGGLASWVVELEMVTAGGERVTTSRFRDGDRFAGSVVALGGLGVVTHVTLELVRGFTVHQRVYEDLPLSAVIEHFDELVGCAHSVCVFTDWEGPEVMTWIWVQEHGDQPEPDLVSRPWFSAHPAPGPRHPIRTLPADSCTTQLGEPGPWHERLPHFRPDFLPSAGDELQSEYMIASADAPAALAALDGVKDRIRPALLVSEVRTIAADDLWMSTTYGRASVSVHFTWVADTEVVLPAVRVVEEALAPFGARPHWAKVFTTDASTIRGLYPRRDDFVELTREYDPQGKFRNSFLEHYVLGEQVRGRT